MIINPVKKAQVLFNKLSQTEDKESSKRYSDVNPFFSWHANYITVDRKKVIIMVNDLTLLPLLINDVNAKAKPELDKIIETGIKEMFHLIGVDDKNINLYFQQAGEIEINAAYNRRTMGHINNYLYYFRELDLSQRYPWDVCLYLAKTPQMNFSGLDSASKTLKVFSEGINISDDWQEAYKIEKTWEPFSKWSKYAEEEEWFEEYDQIADEVRENNQKMLSSFELYLLNKEQLSKSTVRKYVSSVKDYTDLYLLYYGISTVVTDRDEVIGFFSDFYVRKFMWASKTNLQQSSRALKKLYDFLYQAEEISTEHLKEIKWNIVEDTKEGIEHMEYMDSGIYDI